MANVVKIGFNVLSDGNIEFFVVRDDYYTELVDTEIDDIKDVFDELLTYSEKVKTKTQKQLEEVEEQKVKMLEVVIDNTTDEQKLEMMDVFPEWNSNSVEYKVGDYITFDGRLFRVLTDHTSQSTWDPIMAVALFTQINKKGEILEFGKMADGSDRNLTTNPYELGDQCVWEDYIWEWILDGVKGIWNPEDYPEGWEKIRPI